VDILEKKCIEAAWGSTDPPRRFTVAEYDAAQSESHEQPLWARELPRVQDLNTDLPSGTWPPLPSDRARIIHLAAYDAQMRHLAGLD
jgi:hypothetical protein